MLANVQQTTIRPIIEGVVAPGSMHPHGRIFDLCPPDGLGLRAQNGLAGRGEYARDEDGDGFCEVHVNTLEVRRCGAD